MPETCTLHIVQPHKVWIQLWATNQWLFSLDTEYELTFVCGNDIYHKTLSGNGLLAMQAGCTLNDDKVSIKAFNDVQVRILRESFQPNINITLDDINSVKERSAFVFTHSEVTNHDKELTAVLKEINHIKSHQTKLQELQPHDVHMFSVGYAALGLLGIISIYLIVKHLRRNRAVINNEGPIAAPRRKTQKRDYQLEVKDFKEPQDAES